MAREPSETEIMRRAIEGRLLDVRTTFAGEIVSFDANTMRATVRPAVRVQGVDLDSDGEVDTMPDLEGVPVLFPGAGSGILYFPLAEGDPVRIEFCEEDDAEFYWDAAAALPVNPTNMRRHGGAVVCRPEGSRGLARMLSESTAKGLLGAPGGTCLTWNEIEMQLGDSTATDPVALKSLVLAALNSIRSAFNSHTHLTAGTGSPVPPAAPQQIPAFSEIGASKVKAK